MKSILAIVRAAGLLLLAVLVSGQLAQAQTPLLQLKAANYNPTTGLWTATVGPNAQATGTFPTLSTGVSPNGSSAVVFGGAGQLTLASTIAAAQGYTAFAYIKPATTTGTGALFGGSSGAFEYRVNNGKQDALKQQTTDLGSETTTLSTSAFSLVDVTVTNVGGGSFRLNGMADGNNAAVSSFTQPIAAIGARSITGGEVFSGSVCEIDIYAGVLTPAQISTIEQTISAAYDAAPAVASDTAASPNPATVNGNDTLSASFSGAIPLGYQWFVSANSSGTGATPITGATNTTLTLTNLQPADSGKYYSLRATNTISPYSANSTWLQLNVVALTPLVQLIATNYDGSSVWTDTSGNANNATYTVGTGGGTAPTLASFVTPNGSSAVNITASKGYFTLGSPVSASSGYTVFAYFQPTVTNDASHTGRFALTGGNSGSLEYNNYQGHQNYLVEYVGGGGAGTGNIPTNSFSMVDVAVNSAAGSFRLNGASDGSVAGATFSAPLSLIGNNHGYGDTFIGNIAEIDIYNGALTYIQITNIEAQLTAKYITANNIVIGAATVSPTNNTYAGNSVTLAASVIGGSGTTTYRWQTDNGSSGASFANISGATSTNYVLSTTGLNGTYQYRLIGTPFGGTSVTSAPVTLTVNPASAPLVLTDTTPNPNTATANGNATFTASFVGNLPITYQWQVSPNASGSPATSITGATNTTLVLTNVTLASSGNYYSLKAMNAVSPYSANSSWAQLTVVPLTPLVQLIATNYNAGTVTWSDSSGNGNDAYYSGSGTTTPPALAPFVTPNGSSALTVAGGSFSLNSSLDPSQGYTVFAYVMPTTVTGGRFALTGGTTGSLEYNFYQTNQNYLVEWTGGGGAGTATIPTTSFSLVDLAVNSAGGAFRLNGASDGSVPGTTFSAPLSLIGNNHGGGDGLVGDIAEIDVYSGVLSYIQITNIEAQLTAKYITASSIAIGAATVAPTNNVYAGTPVKLAAPVIGGTLTTTYQWQTDNGSSGAVFSNITGANTTNYVLTTTGLLGTYQLQLIGTPFGGTSVTSAPVTLTVNPASAPVVLTDTAPNPNAATVNGNPAFTASFTGTLPITYQWQVSPNASGSPATSITGATNTTLVLTNVQLASSGNYYSLKAVNAVSPYSANSSWAQLTVVPLTPLVQLVATNYNAVSGIWTDASANVNDATYTGTYTPTLDSAVTPNGSSVVDISAGDGYFTLASALDPSSGYTVFAYVMPTTVSSGGARFALTGGTTGSLEYNFYQGHQNYLAEWVGGGGAATATIPTTSFSLVNLAVNSAGGAFRLNGASDGSISGTTFSAPLSLIGNNHGYGDGFVGDIAEIDIYNGALSYMQITNIEAQLTAKYVTVTIASNPTNITAVVTGSTLSLTWPGDHLGWTLQTNSVDISNPSDWFAYPGSTGVTNENITIQPNQPKVFFRLKR